MDYKELEKIKTIGKDTYIYGTGLIGYTWGYDLLENAGFSVRGYIDQNLTEKTINGVPTMRLEDIQDANSLCVFVAARELHQENIISRLKLAGVRNVYRMGTDCIQEVYASIEQASDEIKRKYSGVYDDKKFLAKRFYFAMKRELHFECPLTYNEKIQWLKIHERKPEYIMMVDKSTAKSIAEKTIGNQYITRTYGIYKTFDDIDISELPNRFVAKCTHDSGTVYLCDDKQHFFDDRRLRDYFCDALKRNYYVESREWPYKNIEPQIIIEERLESDFRNGINDYKFFCFNGVVDNIMVVRDRASGSPKYYHFDKEWRLLRYNRLCRSLPEYYSEEKPFFIDEMIELAECLSKGISHIRIDMYESNGRIYFGEYTFYNCGGYESGFDEKTEQHLGALITDV